MTKPRSNSSSLLCLCVCILSLLSNSCAYRFTNVVMSAPVGIQSIAIEGVYNTSREVIPHEILWNALSEQFAKNGRLQVTSKENADAILRVRLSDASVKPSGSPSSESIYKDPVVTTTDKRTPFEFKNLRRAGNWTTEERLSFALTVEVYNLHTKKLIFSRSYSTSGAFRSIRASTVATSNSGYLLYEEALEARMKSLSTGIASNIVTDILL